MGGGARALVRQLKTAVFFCENRRNQAVLKVLRAEQLFSAINRGAMQFLTYVKTFILG